MINKMKRVFKYCSLVLVLALCAGLFTACGTEPVELVSNMVSLEYTSVKYDGAEKKPAVLIKNGETEIDANEYEVSYKNNINAGTASVKISAKEDAKTIKGTVVVGFVISKSSTEVSSLDEVVSVLGNTNFNYATVLSEITISKNQTINIPEGFTINFGNKKLINNGKVVNNGTIIQNVNIEGMGEIENKGEIVAGVVDFDQISSALNYANIIKIEEDIALPSNQDNYLISFNNAKYPELTIDLNGKTINRGFKINSDGNIDKISFINSSEREAKIDTTGIDFDITPIALSGNADKSTPIKVELKNIKFIGESALISKSANGSSFYQVVANDCKFIGTEVAGALQANYGYTFINCEFEGKTAIYLKSGEYNFENCTLTATKENYVVPEYSDNQCVATGSAMVVDSAEGFIKNLKVVINGGKITSESGNAIEEIATSTPDGDLVYYSEIIIKKQPTYSVKAEKEAVYMPTISLSSITMDAIKTGVDKISSDIENCSTLKSSTIYTVEEIVNGKEDPKTPIIADFEYYVQLGTIKNIPSVKTLKVGDTLFVKDQTVKMSIGNSSYINDKAFYVEDNKLYVALPILMFETQSNKTIAINGREFKLNLYGSVRNIGIREVKYNGIGNVIEQVGFNRYNLTVSVANDPDYLEIFYAGAEGSDQLITRKLIDNSVSYGLTGVEKKEGSPLGYYPVGWWQNPVNIPTTYENTTINYSVFVVGKGMINLEFHIDLKDVH